MKYALPILSGPALELAGKPKLGIDTQTEYALTPFIEVGGITQSAAGAQIALTGVSFDTASTTITHTSSTAFAAGAVVSGAGIPDGATVATKTDATHFELSVNTTAAVTGGTLGVDLPGTAALALSGTYVPPDTGYDMQLVLKTAQPNVTSVTRLNFAVTYSDGSSGTATAVIKPPLYAPQSPDSAKNIAVDLTTADGTKNIKAITGLTSIFGGATGVQFSIWKLPEAADWVLVEGNVTKNITPGSPGAVSIWDGYDISTTKEGRGTAPTVSLSAKHGTFAKGLARLNGQRISLRFTTRDNRATVASVEVCGDVFLDLDLPRGEANEDQVITGKSSFSKFAIFV